MRSAARPPRTSTLWAPTTAPTSSHVLIEHWNGSHWRVAPGRNPGAGYNIFNGVFALSARGIWAVGTTASKTGHNRTLIEHCR